MSSPEYHGMSIPTELPVHCDNVVESLPDVSINVSASEHLYHAHFCFLVHLVTLYLGLMKADGSKLDDIEVYPWRSETKASVKPKAKDLKEKVKRWTSIFSEICIQSSLKAWGVPELIEKLTRNPICNTADVQFLVEEFNRNSKMRKLFYRLKILERRSCIFVWFIVRQKMTSSRHFYITTTIGLVKCSMHAIRNHVTQRFMRYKKR